MESFADLLQRARIRHRTKISTDRLLLLLLMMLMLLLLMMMMMLKVKQAIEDGMGRPSSPTLSYDSGQPY